jgi:hypothetical protein
MKFYSSFSTILYENEFQNTQIFHLHAMVFSREFNFRRDIFFEISQQNSKLFVPSRLPFLVFAKTLVVVIVVAERLRVFFATVKNRTGCIHPAIQGTEGPNHKKVSFKKKQDWKYFQPYPRALYYLTAFFDKLTKTAGLCGARRG